MTTEWARWLCLIWLLLFPLFVTAATPAAPSMNISTSGQTVTVGWSTAGGTTSYVLYYAPYPNADYIRSVEMGTATSLTVTLPLGAAYFVAIRARNADGESPYSNIGSVIIPSGGTIVLQTGDYWEFEWSSRTISRSSSSTTSTENNGVFRVTLGAPQSLGGRIAFPIVVSGDAGARPIWNYLAADGPVLLGTRDGVTYSTIFGGDAGGWKGAGFFAFFPPDRTGIASLGTFEGLYTTTSAWIVDRSSSIGGCTYYPEVGETVCEQDSSSFSQREYHKTGVGPIGYRFSSSAVFQGGGFITTHNTLHTAELLKSSKVADDGTYFAGPPWRSLPDPGGAPSFGWDLGAHNGLVLAFGGWFTDTETPWVQAFDPNSRTWDAPSSSGAGVLTVLGVSGGRLYAVGRTSSTAATSLLRFDAATNRWQSMGAGPWGSAPPGRGAVLANGELVVVNTGHPYLMYPYIYSPATGTWRTGARYSSSLSGPAVAAVGNDFYIIGGSYSDGSITGQVRRYRAETNTWDYLLSMPPMPTVREGAVGVTVGSKVYVIGGSNRGIDDPQGRIVEILDTATSTWSAGPALPQTLSGLAATVLEGRIYVIGQTDSSPPVSVGFVLSP